MRSLPLAVLLVGICGGAASARIYKWVDESGSVHFSDKALENDAAEVYVPPAVNTYKDEFSSATSSSRDQVNNYLSNQQAKQDFRKKLREQEAKSKADLERIQRQGIQQTYRERVKDLHQRRWERQEFDRRAGIR